MLDVAKLPVRHINRTEQYPFPMSPGQELVSLHHRMALTQIDLLIRTQDNKQRQRPLDSE